MSKDTPQPQQSEEVDLGQLFKLIGNAFDRLFKFIGGVFIGLYSLFLLLLLHFYNRFIWYVAVVVIGLILGFIIDKKSKKLYGANLHIETNFNSARQVYENIYQFNQLANDSIELAKRLKITVSEASKLKGFYIEADRDENKIAEMYSAFYLRLDSLSRRTMTYEKYKESLTPFNFGVHQIGVASTDKAIYKVIEKELVDQISQNAYLNELAKSNTSILKKKDEVLSKQVAITDSLVNEYLKIRISESKKEPISGSGTNIYMGNAESTNLIVDESKIIQQRLVYENQRRIIDSSLVSQKNIINILADFPESGYDISKWYSKMKFLIPIALFSMTLLMFTIISLGKYLEKQNK